MGTTPFYIMMANKTTQNFNWQVLLLFIPVAYVSSLFHELGHWIIGEILGNDMAYSLDGVWPKDGIFIGDGHSMYVTIGGPAFSILQATIFVVLLEKSGSKYTYPFIFYPLFSRFFSQVFGEFHVQDEARISAALNLGSYTIAVIVLSILIILVWRGTYKLRYGYKELSASFLAGTICKLLVIGTHELIK